MPISSQPILLFEYVMIFPKPSLIYLLILTFYSGILQVSGSYPGKDDEEHKRPYQFNCLANLSFKKVFAC